MPENNIPAPQEAETAEASYTGTMKISVVSSIGLVPVEDATVTISYTGDPQAPLNVLTTDSSGQTPVVSLPAPFGALPPAGK